MISAVRYKSPTATVEERMTCSIRRAQRWSPIAAGLATIVLCACGASPAGHTGRDDIAAVKTVLERYERASQEKDYSTLCDELFAASYAAQAASSGLPCEVALRTALEDVRNPKLKILSIAVNGDRAAARVRGTAAGQAPAEEIYGLRRERGAWRILPPRPAAAATAP
jgi:hypothetical protein